MSIQERKEIARYLLSRGDFIEDKFDPLPSLVKNLFNANIAPSVAPFDFKYPNKFEPLPIPVQPRPKKSNALPEAPFVIITWTIAESKALADIFTRPFNPTKGTVRQNYWYEYDRNFHSKYKNKIREGAPSRRKSLLGSYFLSSINGKKILCFKSELHLNQDGIRTGNGTATLPVKELIKQVINETNAKYIFTTGTCGATYRRHGLGDVVVTKSSKFRMAAEFKNELFNNKSFKSNWNIPTTLFRHAEQFMQAHVDRFKEPGMLPPTEKYGYKGRPLLTKSNRPNIYLEGLKLPDKSPILTTDYFEFSNSTNNNLASEGCGVEMGDAVLGLVCSELRKKAPKWAVIRNLSDPVINGNLREDGFPIRTPRIALQTMWAVWYYETYGYWTSINSALVAWSIIAAIVNKL